MHGETSNYNEDGKFEALSQMKASRQKNPTPAATVVSSLLKQNYNQLPEPSRPFLEPPRVPLRPTPLHTPPHPSRKPVQRNSPPPEPSRPPPQPLNRPARYDQHNTPERPSRPPPQPLNRPASYDQHNTPEGPYRPPPGPPLNVSARYNRPSTPPEPYRPPPQPPNKPDHFNPPSATPLPSPRLAESSSAAAYQVADRGQGAGTWDDDDKPMAPVRPLASTRPRRETDELETEFHGSEFAIRGEGTDGNLQASNIEDTHFSLRGVLPGAWPEVEEIESTKDDMFTPKLLPVLDLNDFQADAELLAGESSTDMIGQDANVPAVAFEGASSESHGVGGGGSTSKLLASHQSSPADTLERRFLNETEHAFHFYGLVFPKDNGSVNISHSFVPPEAYERGNGPEGPATISLPPVVNSISRAPIETQNSETTPRSWVPPRRDAQASRTNRAENATFHDSEIHEVMESSSKLTFRPPEHSHSRIQSLSPISPQSSEIERSSHTRADSASTHQIISTTFLPVATDRPVSPAAGSNTLDPPSFKPPMNVSHVDSSHQSSQINFITPTTTDDVGVSVFIPPATSTTSTTSSTTPSFRVPMNVNEARNLSNSNNHLHPIFVPPSSSSRRPPR